MKLTDIHETLHAVNLSPETLVTITHESKSYTLDKTTHTLTGDCVQIVGMVDITTFLHSLLLETMNRLRRECSAFLPFEYAYSELSYSEMVSLHETTLQGKVVLTIVVSGILEFTIKVTTTGTLYRVLYPDGKCYKTTRSLPLAVHSANKLHSSLLQF